MAAILIPAVATIISLASGTPEDLPTIALGWDVLLHVERVVALIGLVAVATLVIWRAAKGELPVRIGEIEYAAETAQIDEEFERRLVAVEARVTAIEVDRTGSHD